MDETLWIVPDDQSADRLRARGHHVHVTGGVLDPINDRGPASLDPDLTGIRSVVIAMPSTLEGQLTAMNLSERLAPFVHVESRPLEDID